MTFPPANATFIQRGVVPEMPPFQETDQASDLQAKSCPLPSIKQLLLAFG